MADGFHHGVTQGIVVGAINAADISQKDSLPTASSHTSAHFAYRQEEVPLLTFYIVLHHPFLV